MSAGGVLDSIDFSFLAFLACRPFRRSLRGVLRLLGPGSYVGERCNSRADSLLIPVLQFHSYELESTCSQN